MNTRNSYLKYVAILLGIIFLIAAAFLFWTLWENRQDDLQDPGYVEDEITYEGREYVRKDQIETFLIMGLDRYENSPVSDAHGTGVQADFLLLLVFDHETRQSTALQINRDSMTKVNKLSIGGTAVVDSYTAQIALAYNYVNDDNEKIRCRNTIDSVEYLLKGIDVDHYFALTMDAVAASCDAVGGVEVTVLDDFTGIDDTLVKGETVRLNGQQALRYVRTRYGLEDSSNSTRMARQQQYLDALYDSVSARINWDQDFIIELVDAVDDYVVYDSSDQRLQQLLETFNEYEYLGIRQLEGQTKLGEEFMEFYPDEASVRETVIQLCYTPKNGDE
jgi:LCP family protein required for cell wall assembly